MAKIVAIAGLGDEATVPPAPSGTRMLGWGLVLGTTIGIFVTTLLIKPPKGARKRRS